MFFLKTVILSKSCSRCVGSTIFKGQALQKSGRRATLNGTSKEKRRKTLAMPSLVALFRHQAHFLAILVPLQTKDKTPQVQGKSPKSRARDPNDYPVFCPGLGALALDLRAFALDLRAFALGLEASALAPPRRHPASGGHQ